MCFGALFDVLSEVADVLFGVRFGFVVFIVLFDREKQKLYEFNSTNDFDCRVVSKLLHRDVKVQFQYEKYNNTDYAVFSNDKGDKSDIGSMYDYDIQTTNR